MSELTLTDGTRIIFNFQCTCGLTGGCEKCQPIDWEEEHYRRWPRDSKGGQWTWNPNWEQDFIYTSKMQKEDIELAEVGMEEYARQLEREDND